MMTEAATRLREEPIRKLFFSYLIPSSLGLLLMSINTVIDGIFIGHGVGPNGLAGVNISVPVYSIFYSVALWIGIGGATVFSMCLGQNERAKARSIFTQSFVIALIMTFVITGFCLWYIEELAYLLGANDAIMPYVLDYMTIILWFGFSFVLETMISIFVRNDGNPNLAMIALAVTSVLNIILNYLFIFIFEWGVAGAAYATVVATFLGTLVLLPHFFLKNSTLKFVKFRFQKSVLKEVLSLGLPSFMSEMAIALVMIGYNVAFMLIVGELGVASYAIVNYMHMIGLLSFIGVSTALQPLVSFHYGAKLFLRMRQILRLGVVTSFVLGCLIVLAGWLFAGPITSLFNVDDKQLYDMTVNGLRLFFINYLFMGYNLVYVTYYQSIGQAGLSLAISVARGIVFVLMFLLILPPLFGVNGIWLAVPVAEGLTVLLIWVMNRLRSPIMEY